MKKSLTRLGVAIALAAFMSAGVVLAQGADGRPTRFCNFLADAFVDADFVDLKPLIKMISDRLGCDPVLARKTISSPASVLQQRERKTRSAQRSRSHLLVLGRVISYGSITELGSTRPYFADRMYHRSCWEA